MCFGFDGDRALSESLEKQGASRRGVLRGAFAGVAGAAAVGSVAAAAPASATTRGKSRTRQVPEGRISIQLYTLRDATVAVGTANKPWAIGWEAVMERLAQYGYPRVERAGLYGQSAATIKAALDGLGIVASSSHDGISTSTAAMNQKFDDANTFGQRYINVPFLNSTKLEDWQSWAEQMNIEAYVARRRGLRYGYHNHAHEFTIKLSNGKTPWEVLCEELDPRLVHFEIDLYWAYTAGVNTGAADPLAFAQDVVRNSPLAVRQYHVKDRHAAESATPGDMADLGTGVIDFGSIFKRHEVEEYIVENDTPDVSPLTSAAVGKLYLEHLDY